MREKPSSLEALLDEGPWLYNLARRLVLDDASAEDLLQETWVAALERPPSDASAPRPWLATVLRRIAIKRRKKDGRSQQLVSREGTTSGAGPRESAEQGEAARRLQNAVESLPPQLHEVVQRCYKQGQTHAEAATELRMSERNVRLRLASAYERIRNELGSTPSDDGTAPPTWQLAIAPLLRRPSNALRSSALVGSSALAWWVAAAAASLLAVLGFWIRCDGDSDTTTAVSPTGAQSSVGDAVAPYTAEGGESTRTTVDAPVAGEPARTGGASTAQGGADVASEDEQTAPLRFHVTGRVKIDGSVPEGLFAILMPHDWLPVAEPDEAQKLPIGEGGEFEVIANETGGWDLLISPPVLRPGTPCYRMFLDLAPGREQTTAPLLDIVTGSVCVEAPGRDGQRIVLHCQMPDWEWSQTGLIEDGATTFESVPTGSNLVRLTPEGYAILDDYPVLGNGWVSQGEQTVIKIPR